MVQSPLRALFPPRRRRAVGALCAGALLCALAPAQADTVAERLERRGFPSVFQAWSPVENTGEGELDAAARHDLYWRTSAAYGLEWDVGADGRATAFTPASVERARAKRAALLARNPDMVLLAQLRVWTGPPGFLPEDDPWWRRENGERVLVYPEFEAYKLDMANPDYQSYLGARARALIDSGAVDGIMIDSWNEDDEPEARAAILERVRAEVGEAPILVNANAAKPVRSAPYVNGLFMEVGDATDRASWAGYRDVMAWAGANLRRPSFTAFEIMRELDGPEDLSRTDPEDLRRMRATTALSLVGSDGFALYADPNSLPDQSDHRHDWYPFWDVELGRPTGPAVDLVGGAVRRDYERGVALYNPPGAAAARVEFDRPVRSAAAGGPARRSHRVGPFEGDLFLYADGADDPPAPVEVAPVEAAPVEAALGGLDAPARVGASDRVEVAVPYASDAPAELVLSLQDTANGWTVGGYARVPVPAGDSVARVEIDVAADAAPGDAWAWTAWLAAPGDGWEARLDARTVEPVTVGAGPAFEDAVVELGPIPPLRAGGRFAVEVRYAAAGPRTINVSLQDVADGWTTRAFARADVPAGSGTERIELEVDSAAPPGAGYTLGAYLTPRGGQWPSRLDDARVSGLSVGGR